MEPHEYNRNRYDTRTDAAHHMTAMARGAQVRLVNLGYQVAIDGKWGPQSQLASARASVAALPRRVPVDAFLEQMRGQIGKPYEFGARAACDDPSPPSFDCAEILRWAGCRLGVDPVIPDGSWIQLQHCAGYSTLIDVGSARSIRGALLYSCASGEPPEAPWGSSRPASSHVAVSLGNGRTIEARPSNENAVSEQPFDGRGWRYAALIPGLEYDFAS